MYINPRKWQMSHHDNHRNISLIAPPMLKPLVILKQNQAQDKPTRGEAYELLSAQASYQQHHHKAIRKSKEPNQCTKYQQTETRLKFLKNSKALRSLKSNNHPNCYKAVHTATCKDAASGTSKTSLQGSGALRLVL